VVSTKHHRGPLQPIYVGPLNPLDRHRQVRVEPPSGTPIWRSTANETELIALVAEIRPDLDVKAHPELIHWISDPWTWSGI
jgi:hypothetical protein